MIDAFISHSSANRTTAVRIEEALEADGLAVWLDDSEIQLGVLLGEELQASIRGARVLILLWSAAAAESRWVASEWLTAYHVHRFIIPCSLDKTPLPQCLQNSVRLKFRRVTAVVVEDLARADRESPRGSNRLAPAMSAQGPELSGAISRIGVAQAAIQESIASGDMAAARRQQSDLDSVVDDALATWPLDPVLVNLAGYQLKNAYMLKHWDAIQAGRGPRDPLLDQSERRFLETLALDPTDPESLNGLGNIFFFKRDLDAAEFFHRAALAEAKRRNLSYPAAEHDLALVRRFKGG
jgi:tetratricopeptide (TPR) repeat protein